ncbi:MAG: ArsR/SmtB family transcription factor [bacterium]
MHESPRQVKMLLMEQFARVGKALSSPRRLEILDLLCQGTRTVEELAQATFQSIANASQHLQVLKRARLVESHKQGLHVHYSLADEAVCELWRALQKLGASRLAEVQQVLHDYFHARDALQPMAAPELLEEVQSDQVIILDVRPFREYQQGHIPGAISLPLSELEARLEELPRDAEIVAYCRGPYCVLAPTAVEMLQKHGFRARRLVEGLPDWRQAGFPVERTEADPRTTKGEQQT